MEQEQQSRATGFKKSSTPKGFTFGVIFGFIKSHAKKKPKPKQSCNFGKSGESGINFSFPAANYKPPSKKKRKRK